MKPPPIKLPFMYAVFNFVFAPIVVLLKKMPATLSERLA
jgi:hypothetical protein